MNETVGYDSHFHLNVELEFSNDLELKRFLDNINITGQRDKFIKYNDSYLMINKFEVKHWTFYFSVYQDCFIDNLVWFKEICHTYSGNFKVYAIDHESVELLSRRYILSNENGTDYNIKRIDGDYIETLLFQYILHSKFNLPVLTALESVDNTFFSNYSNNRIRSFYDVNKILVLFLNCSERYKKYKEGIYDDCSLIFLRWEYMSSDNYNYSQLQDSEKVLTLLEMCDKSVLYTIFISFYGVEYEKDFVQYLISFENCRNFINKEIENFLLKKLNKNFSPFIHNATEEVYMLSYYITDKDINEKLYNIDNKFLKYTDNNYLSPKLLMIKTLKEDFGGIS